MVATGLSYDARVREAQSTVLARLIPRVRDIRRFGSAALDLAYVACGRFDGFFEFGLKPWDIAAGALLVQEGGGTITEIDGNPLSLQRGDVLACGPAIEAQLKRECALFLAELGWRPPG
jgi:myo-inositol-1(or 4)-monophosphatase